MVRITLEQAKARLSRQSKSTTQADDSGIDFTDVPELSDEQLRKMKRVGPGRPPLGNATRKMISIKLDPELLQDLKREAKRSGRLYQSLIHEILQKHIKRSAA
jgi:uncharacterized protein (DUF4415 family)